MPNLQISCGRLGCPKTFRTFGSRSTHIYRDHKGFDKVEHSDGNETKDRNEDYQMDEGLPSSEEQMNNTNYTEATEALSVTSDPETETVHLQLQEN